MIKKIIVTGGCGFIGSHFIDLAIKNKLKVINIDNLSTGSNKKNIKKQYNFYKFFNIDINNYNKLNNIFFKYNPNAVINFAAETHVDRSISNPKKFIKTNITGPSNLALTYYNYIKAKKLNNYKFIHISTDEVYGSTTKNSFKEKDILKPNSPYSASKASADLLLRSFEKTYDFKSVIIRPSNNFGPGQFKEKLIPLYLERLKNYKKIPVYGNGKNKREWFYVEDCVKTIFNILISDIKNGIYNIGSEKIVSNIDLIKLICFYFKKMTTNSNLKNLSKNNYEFVTDRPGHDYMYKQNLSKIKKLGLLESSNFEINLQKTIDWYLNN